MFFRDNGAKMYIIGVTNNAVFSYTLSTPWDVSTAVADFLVKSYLVSTQTANPIDFYVGDNGTKLYVLSGGAATTDTVFQYTLSTAWDVTSASYSNKSFSVNTQSSSSEGIFFKLDGTKMYVLNNGGTNADIIYQYTLSSAWDVSTASYDNVSFNVSSQESAPAGLYISPNGSKMYVGGQTGDDINEYDLITPWNVGSAVFVRASAVIGDATQGGIYFKSDGTRMYLIGGTNSNIFEYSLSIAWDVSTLSLTRTLPYNAAFFSGTPTGIFLKDDGAKVYVSNYTSNRVTELSLSVPWQITSVVGRYSAAAEDTACNSLYISPDGLRMYITGQTGDDVNQYDLSVAWDVSSATFVRVSATHGEGTATGLFFKSDGARMYVIGTTLDTIREFTLSTPWDVSTMVLDRQRYVSNFDTAPTGIHISPDGLQMYITGATNNTVYQFTLSQAWRSTYIAGYVTVQPEETGPLGMYISPDGFNLYVTGNTGDDVNQYLLDVAWDIGSAHYVRVSAYIGDTEPRGVYFSSDGTKMIVTGQTGDEFRQFSLSTPWNVSTAVLYDIFYYGHLYASVTCVHFSPDGLYMYWINGTIVYRFTLAQAFESNKVIGTYCVSKEETAPTAMHFNSTGTKLYVTGQTGDDVNEYTLSTPWDITTITYDRVSIGHGEATVTGLTIDETNGYLYICGSTLDTIRRFTISGGDVSTLTFVDSASIGFEPTSSGLLIADDYFILTGTTNDCAYSIDRPSVIFGGAFFEDGAFYANGASGYAYIGGSEANVRSLSVPSASWRTTPSENWGGILFTGGTAIRKYISSNTPYLESIALSQTLAITEPYGVSVNSKGTRIYVTLGTTTADKTGRSIRLVTMTTPFDLSTATLDSVEVIGAPGLLGNPANLWNIYVTPDEMRMFVMSPTVQGIYQFSRRFL
jgi:6-phosphogluconolactonase (cycloisomerase 2 family)